MTNRIFSYRLIICFVLFAGFVCANGAETPSIQPSDGDNLALEALSPTHLIVSLTHPVHNWFSGNFTSLSTDQRTSIELSMDGNATERNTADVTKWVGLRPVMTHADPTKYESYEWFEKDAQGRWVSGDPFKTSEARFAGNAKLPQQQAISDAVAAQFLSSDGHFWSPWREVDHAVAQPEINCLHMEQQFATSNATIAMRVPYTYTYEQAFIAKLQSAKLKGVFVDEIGTTPENRKIQVIRLEPMVNDAMSTDHPTVLVYAREHATEPDSSWAVEGLLRWLLSDDADARLNRSRMTWLIIPLLDLDSASSATFKTGDFFRAVDPVMPEALLYAKYLIKRLDVGGSIDIAVNLHNMECAEGANLCCPLVDKIRQQPVTQLNQTVFEKMRAAGYTIGDPAGMQIGFAKSRLAGWCAHRFGTLDLAFEVNSRDPNARMNLQRLQQVGAFLACELDSFSRTPAFSAIKNEIRQRLAERKTQLTTWWASVERTPDTSIPYDTFMGY